MDIKSFTNKIESLVAKGARFVAFNYRSKKTGEYARYNMQLNVDIERTVLNDLHTVLMFPTVEDKPHGDARFELIESFRKTLELGAGNNPGYTKQGLYDTVGATKGALKVFRDDTFELFGFQRGRKVIEKGEYKKVNSSAKTLAKNELRKASGYGKFRTLCIDVSEHKPSDIRLEGETIEIG